MIKLKRNKFLIITASVVVLLTAFHWLGLLRPLENSLIRAIKPLSGRLYSFALSLNPRAEMKMAKEDLIARINSLEAEVARLTVADARSLEIAEENRQLREQLRFRSQRQETIVSAKVIAKEDFAGSGEVVSDLIIDQGSDSGLTPGLGVLSSDGIIVGKIISVSPQTSLVCLTIGRNCQLAAAILNQDKTLGLTDGDLGLTIRMSFIPQLEKISVGETVVTSGLGGLIPRGLVIGKVSRVEGESNDVWQSAIIEPLIDLNNLTLVSIILP